jgi:hypothetical protein
MLEISNFSKFDFVTDIKSLADHSGQGYEIIDTHKHFCMIESNIDL